MPMIRYPIYLDDEKLDLDIEWNRCETWEAFLDVGDIRYNFTDKMTAAESHDIQYAVNMETVAIAKERRMRRLEEMHR